MSVLTYLTDKLSALKGYQLTSFEKDFLEKNGLEAFIFRALTNKKYRKWKPRQGYDERIKQAISINVSKQKPLEIRLPFGGYKLWRIPTTPEADWAEFFMLAYYSEYFRPVLAVYPPGINFVFSSDDTILERMNNLPRSEPASYLDSLQKLLRFFQKYLPSNLKIGIKRVVDMYDSEEEFWEKVESYIPEMEEKYKKMDKDNLERELKAARLNFKKVGVEDLSNLPEQDLYNRILKGPIVHDAHRKLRKRFEFLKGDDKIMIFPDPIPMAVPLGSCKTSATRFWIGMGVLEKYKDSFREWILSPRQVEQTKDLEYEAVNIDLVPLNNFKSIRVYPEHSFEFANK